MDFVFSGGANEILRNRLPKSNADILGYRMWISIDCDRDLVSVPAMEIAEKMMPE